MTSLNFFLPNIFGDYYFPYVIPEVVSDELCDDITKCYGMHPCFIKLKFTLIFN